MHDLCESVQIINRALGHKQGTKIERVVLNLEFFVLNRAKVSNLTAAHLYPNIGRVPPPGLEYRYWTGVHIKPDSFRCRSARKAIKYSVNI